MEPLEKTIRKYALQNAVKFEGKANPGNVIGKVIGEHPELKQNTKELAKQVARVVKDINHMTVIAQLEELQQLAPELLEKKEAKPLEWPELKNAVHGKVVTRIPPEPSKYIHLGHALSFLINAELAKKYDGKTILRFEDTNVDKAAQEYVDAILDDVQNYLKITPAKIVYISDDLPKLYALAEELITQGKAYVCTCDRESMQALRHQGKVCECRTKPQQLAQWKEMVAGKIAEGDAVLRLSGDMQATNQVMRDPVLFLINKGNHYRQGAKYAVWPLYDIANVAEDEWCGVTHILRSSEFGQMRVELQDQLRELFGWKKKEVLQYGRFNVIDSITKGREIRELIEKEEVSGWDDPRLVTIKTLKRRGIQPQACYDLALDVGLSPSQTNIDWDKIAAFNRKILDATAQRFFAIIDPVEVVITGAPQQSVELDLHPDQHHGGRKFLTHEQFLISPTDAHAIKPGKLYRLMDCLNFRKEGEKFVFDSRGVEEYRKNGERIMHWLPADREQLLDIEIVLPDNSKARGVAEHTVKQVKIGEVVQFERFGFCRLDAISAQKRIFWYGHR